ncbi:SCO7613 C-terminal domain-containing membrane protein [Geodermatophilus sp. SYSU D00703]
MGSAPVPPLPERARPPLVFLVVGAVLVVSAGGAAAAVYGGGSARLLLLGLAAAAAGASAWGSRARLRGTEEVLAAAAVALAVLGADAGASLLRGSAVPPAVLAVGFLVLSRLLPRPATWPLAAWVTGQLAVLRALQGVEDGVPRTVAVLAVALVGLGAVLAGRRIVARVVLLTTVPWWVTGVLEGIATAWEGPGVARWLPAVLTVAAAAELLVVRLERDVEPLLGSRFVVPVVSGVVAGAAVGGPLSAPGPGAVMLSGFAGVLLAAVSAALLTGWRERFLLPVTIGAGGTLGVLSVVQLVSGGRWLELTLLLLLTALPSLLVSVLRPDERPVSVPTTVGCGAGAALCAVAADLLSPAAAAIVLGLLYAGTLAMGLALEEHTRRPTLVAGAVCAAVAVVLLVAARDRPPLAWQLAGQGLLTCAWAWRIWRWGPREEAAAGTRAWRAGAAQLVLAAWTAVALWNWSVLEAFTLPLAAGLLVAAGPRLVDGPSWPAWGPGLLVAAVPSAVWAVVVPGGLRSLLVLLAAAGVMGVAAWRAVRAPLLTGAGTAIGLAVGLALVELPLPVTSALVVGVALVVLGAGRERRPVAGFGARLAEMR